MCSRVQRVKINGCLSDSKPVLSGIPQGSVLGPVLFVIFINDMPLVCNNLCESFLFADDAKLYRHICDIQDVEALNKSCQNIFDWCQNWLMKLNVNKCKVMSIARNKSDIIKYEYGFNIAGTNCVQLEHVSVMTDLGVTMCSDMSFSDHIYGKVNTAFKMLGIINRNFKNLDTFSFLLLYKSIVRSHIEFAHSVWNPYKISLINDLEKVQKRATKMVRSCKNMHYMDRLKFLQLPTLKYRRLRGDMIEVYKIINNIYDSAVVPSLVRNYNTRTRGNSCKLLVERCKYDLRKFSFCNRIISVWNSLSENVVTSPTVNSFKNNLDKFWKHEDVLYNYEACLSNAIY